MEHPLKYFKLLLCFIIAVVVITKQITIIANAAPWHGAEVEVLIVAKPVEDQSDRLIGKSAFLHFEEVHSEINARIASKTLKIGEYIKANQTVMVFDNKLITAEINSNTLELKKINYWLQNVFIDRQGALKLEKTSVDKQFSEEKQLQEAKVSVLQEAQEEGDNVSQQLQYEIKQFDLILQNEETALKNISYQFSLLNYERLSQEVAAERLKEALVLLNNQMEQYTIEANFDGTIVGINEKLNKTPQAAIGTNKISVGEFLFTIAQMNYFIAEATIPQNDLRSISQHQDATCHIPLIDIYVNCTLISVESKGGTTQSIYTAKYELEKFANDFDAGKRVDIYLKQQNKQPMIKIPTRSLDYQNNILGVWVINHDDAPVFRPIKILGKQNLASVTVISGLTSGEKVLIKKKSDTQ